MYQHNFWIDKDILAYDMASTTADEAQPTWKRFGLLRITMFQCRFWKHLARKAHLTIVQLVKAPE